VANRSAALPLLNHDSCFVRNGIVTQAKALKVSDLPGAPHNRTGSNRYRHGQGAQVSDRQGETPVATLA
jgi:hypothetical protein